MATILNLNPPDMAQLEMLQPVTFVVQSTEVAIFVGVWIRYADSNEEILAYNGAHFLFPFDLNSTVFQPHADDTLLQFSIVPEHGWQKEIDEFRIVAAEP